MPAWLLDEGIWTALPGQEAWDERCRFLMADPNQIGIEALEWEPCGEGCARADIYQGHGDVAAHGLISVSGVDGVPSAYLRLGNGVIRANGRLIMLERVIELTTGVTKAVIQLNKDELGATGLCGGSVWLGSGLDAAAFRGHDNLPSRSIRGTWQTQERSWSWQLPWPTAEDMGFSTGYCDIATMEAGGRTFWLCPFGVMGALTPGSSEITVLDDPRDLDFSPRKGAALGDLAMWVESRFRGAAGSRVRGWRPDGAGVRTIMENTPVPTCAVGMSDTHVAGFSSGVGCGYGRDGRLWSAERSAEDTLSNVRVGPILSSDEVAMGKFISTWGEHITVVWGEKHYETQAERGRVLLARTSDWAMRDLRGPEGHEAGSAAVTDEYLYAVFTRGQSKFSHVYRYDLTHFDQIGEPLEPVGDPPLP